MTQKQTIQIAEAKGCPMLHWVGKGAKPLGLVPAPKGISLFLTRGLGAALFAHRHRAW